MARLACQEQSALEALLERYSRLLKGVIFNVIRDEAEAEEVVMEVFLHSWDCAAQYSPDRGTPIGWLITMARRRGIDRLRKRLRYAAATDRLQTEVQNNPIAWVSSTDIDREVERSDVRRFVKAKLEDLPCAQRKIVELAFYKGMSQREIARETKIPLGTVRTRLELGLQKLKRSLYQCVL